MKITLAIKIRFQFIIWLKVDQFIHFINIKYECIAYVSIGNSFDVE